MLSPDSPELAELLTIAKNKLAETVFPFVNSQGGVLDNYTSLLVQLPVKELSKRLVEIVGRKKADYFFEGVSPSEFDSERHLETRLFSILPPCYTLTNENKYEVVPDVFRETLLEVANAMLSGGCDYSISYHIVNIAISEDLILDSNLCFTTLPATEIEAKYRFDSRYDALSPLMNQNWREHRVVAHTHFRGRIADMERKASIREMEAACNEIIHPFYLGKECAKIIPSVTQIRFESPVYSALHYRGFSKLGSTPKLLTPQMRNELIKGYRLLKNACSDRVLEVAVDRFLLGRKRPIHHPNRVNEPYWDKLVDYVITLEALFLTANGNPSEQELSYRFKLNGTSLLSLCRKEEKSALFKALGHLYSIRSKVVHGSNEDAIRKVVNKFIEELNIDDPSHKHSLGRLILVCRQVEDWILGLLFQLDSMKSEDRPYRKQGGWEELLWKSGEKPSSE